MLDWGEARLHFLTILDLIREFRDFVEVDDA